jgi:uncharacterized protein
VRYDNLTKKNLDIFLTTVVSLFSFLGEFGTLAAVSAVTSAVKSLSNNGIRLIGYNGLMLPVMEDVILAQRAAQIPPTYTLRDLLMFSSVCGVGLDTVPVPGESHFNPFLSSSFSLYYIPTSLSYFLLLLTVYCSLSLSSLPLIPSLSHSGDITEESISSIFMETAGLAFRLDKPLSCRLLIMENQKPGDITGTEIPYICNTRVFSV